MNEKKFYWSDSYNQYDKYHLNREEQEPLKKWEVIIDFKKALDMKYCSVPNSLKHECKGKIINAHTVSKSSSLQTIAENGHVYSLLNSIQDTLGNNGIRKEKLVGVNKASTFTGYCSFHDKSLFSPFEDVNFTYTKEQVFLLSYRSLTREIFTKKFQKNIEELLRNADKGKSLSEQFYHKDLTDTFYNGVDIGLKDLAVQKDKFDEILINKNYDEIEGIILEFDKIPNFMCSGSLLLEYDFDGNLIQNLADLDKNMSMIFINILHSGNKGYVVFSWHRDDKTQCNQFINSLKKIKANNISNAIIRFCFEFFENIYLSPKRWDSLVTSKRSKLLNRFENSSDVMTARNRNCLKDDGIGYDDWKFLRFIDI